MDELLKKSQMLEKEIEKHLITPALINSGWKNEQIKQQYTFTDGRVIVQGDKISRGEKKRADYLLFHDEQKNYPLAIIEVKDNKHFVGSGMQQGLNYANILEKSNQLDVPFVYSTNGDKFLEHDRTTRKEREIKLNEFPSPEELWKRYKGEFTITDEQEKLIQEPYYVDVNDLTRKPRYYQRIAINKTIEAIAKGINRILLVMATGTGKTYTAFQIIHRLWKSKTKKKILFLADRNILIDQTIQQDFKPFKKIMTKIKGKKPDSSHEIYLALYQQLINKDVEYFREYKPEFFDLIVIDECHRGSAKKDSNWRKILEYFSSATHIGLTATPKETEEVSNIDYFGEPLYTYSLKQGIEDGFLAPYKVVRVGINIDLEGWRPEKGKTDDDDEEIEDREYNNKDYDKNIIIKERDIVVAKRITEFLKIKDRFAKTIVFCVDIEHAERMRQALVNENSDLVQENDKYIMRITGDNNEGKAQLGNFIDKNEKYPVIVTTSKLMTTGVDCKTCKLIVLEKYIDSMTEFKQIIGRGTRLLPEYGKEYFTIMDFRGVSRLFVDPDFDGEPVSILEVGQETSFEDIIDKPEEPKDEETEHSTPNKKVRVNGVDVSILSERVQYLDNEGRLITESIVDFSRKNILGEYSSLDNFLTAWNNEAKKSAIIDEFNEHGILLDAIRDESGLYDIDEFDLICHVAFDKKPLTKKERANNVRKKGYLHKYSEQAQQVLDALLDKYMDGNITDIENIEILSNDPFRKLGTPMSIVKLFGGKEGYFQAIKELEKQIYAA